MPEAVMEARISVAFDWGNVFLSIGEARELRDQLEDALPPDDITYNKGGSFGFAAPDEERSHEDD